MCQSPENRQQQADPLRSSGEKGVVFAIAAYVPSANAVRLDNARAVAAMSCATRADHSMLERTGHEASVEIMRTPFDDLAVAKAEQLADRQRAAFASRLGGERYVLIGDDNVA
jgi:hypothetical protein